MAEAQVQTRGIGTPYQTVIKFDASGPRIHIFWRGDLDPEHHDHPCDFWTFPLVSYVEEYLEFGWQDGEAVDCRVQRRVVKAFRLHRRKAEFAHRVLGPTFPFDRPIVTLVWWGKKRREWGFYTDEGWKPWREHLGVQDDD